MVLYSDTASAFAAETRAYDDTMRGDRESAELCAIRSPNDISQFERTIVFAFHIPNSARKDEFPSSFARRVQYAGDTR